jgi:uncharacterized membrane protein
VTETPGAQPNPEPDQTPPPPGEHQAPPPPSGDQAPPPGYQAPPPGYQAPPPGYQAPPPGYQAPPPGYQAPPPGYQAPPPGYQAPPPGYQAPPPGYGPAPVQINVGDAFGWGWAKFQQNVGAFVLGLLGYAVLGFVLVGLPYIAFAAAASRVTSDSMASGLFGIGFGAMFLVWILAAVVGFLAQAGLINASLRVANGEQITVATCYKYPNLGSVLVTALLVALGSGIVSGITFGLGGLVVSYFAMFALFFAVDQGLGPVDAIKASFSLVSKNIGSTVVVYILAYIAMGIGAFLLGVGLLVAVPLAMLAFTFTYRRLLNGPLAA